MGTNTTSTLIHLLNGFVSFFVGLFAFIAIKIPLTAITDQFIDLQSGDILSGTLKVLLLILSIIIAIRYTRKLNASGSRISRIKIRILTLLAGLTAIILY